MSGFALSERARRTFGGYFLLTATAIGFGVFRGLPVRYLPVDAAAAALALALAVGGLGLLGKTRWRERVARLVAWLALGVGLALTAALTLTASHIAGLYGPVGAGGALIFALVGLLTAPYLIVGPAVVVHWLSRRGR